MPKCLFPLPRQMSQDGQEPIATSVVDAASLHTRKWHIAGAWHPCKLMSETYLRPLIELSRNAPRAAMHLEQQEQSYLEDLFHGNVLIWRQALRGGRLGSRRAALTVWHLIGRPGGQGSWGRQLLPRRLQATHAYVHCAQSVIPFARFRHAPLAMLAMSRDALAGSSGATPLRHGSRRPSQHMWPQETLESCSLLLMHV